MNTLDLIARLKEHAPAAQALGATAMYLFGSAARGEANARDVDVFIDYDPARKFSLLDLAGLKLVLEDRLAAEVDITTRDSLHPMIRKEIERTAIRVF